MGRAEDATENALAFRDFTFLFHDTRLVFAQVRPFFATNADFRKELRPCASPLY